MFWLYNTIQYNTIQYNTIQYNTIQYNTIQYNTILSTLTAWYNFIFVLCQALKYDFLIKLCLYTVIYFIVYFVVHYLMLIRKDP